MPSIPDESPADAVVRELWEERGLHVEPVTLLGVFGGPSFRVRYANELGGLDLSRWARELLPVPVARRGRTLIPPVTWRPPATGR